MAHELALVSELNETAIRYNRDIKYTTVAVLLERLNQAGILLVPGIQNKMVNYMFLRRGGIMRPYTQGMEASTNELGKFVQNEFHVYRAAGIDKDNIQNYRTVDVVGTNLGAAEMALKNPADPQIFYAVAATWAEDLADIIFHGVRDESGKTKYDLLDGFEKIITDGIESEDISTRNGNLIDLPAITFPTDETDTTAYDIVDEFLAKSRITGKSILNVTRDTGRAISRATFNKFRNTMRADEFGRYVIPGYEQNVRMNVNSMMGKGDRMILSKADVLQLGYDTQFDKPFVRARAIDDDDQIITYNYGAEYGTNILTFNKKMFMTTTGSLSAEPESGDYLGKDEFTLNITSGGNGTVAKSPEKSKYALDEVVTLTATASPSYEFEKWSDENTENPRRLVVHKDVTLSATFKNSGD